MPQNFPVAASPFGHFLQGQLKLTLPTLYKVSYTELWGLDPQQNLHTAIGDLPLTIEQIDAYAMGDFGQMAALYDGNGDDIPLVDIAIGQMPPVPCAMFVQGAIWNEIQIQKMIDAQLAKTNVPSVNIIQAKQAAVADYFNRREHFTVLYGYPKKGLFGVFSLRGITKQDVTFTPYKIAAGAPVVPTYELYNNLSDLIFSFMDTARLSSPSQVQMVVPPQLMRRLVEMYIAPNGNINAGNTVMQMLKSTDLGMGVGSIISRNELKGSNLNKFVLNESGTGQYSASQDRIIFKASTYNIERHYYARKAYPVFQRSILEYEYMVIGATSGMVNYRPEYMQYYDFNNTLV